MAPRRRPRLRLGGESRFTSAPGCASPPSPGQEAPWSQAPLLPGRCGPLPGCSGTEGCAALTQDTLACCPASPPSACRGQSPASCLWSWAPRTCCSVFLLLLSPALDRCLLLSLRCPQPRPGLEPPRGWRRRIKTGHTRAFRIHRDMRQNCQLRERSYCILSRLPCASIFSEGQRGV